MTTWKNIIINKQNIETETAKAVLIKMPKSTGYGKFVFWHPKKLVRAGKGWDYSVSFTDEFQFTLKQYGAGRHNKTQIIHEVKLSAQEFLDLFEK